MRRLGIALPCIAAIVAIAEGHFPLRDAPDDFVREVEEFLSER